MLITGKEYYFSPAKTDYGVFVGYDKEDDETILMFSPIVNTKAYATKNGNVEFTSDGNDSNFIPVEHDAIN